MNLRLPITLALTASLVVAMNGCGKGKIDQCNALIGKMNSSAETLTKGPQPTDDTSTKTYAEGMKKVATEVSSVELEDAKLKELRDQYVKMYNDVGGALLTIVNAPGEPKPEDVAKASAATKEADKLTESINTYCGGK